MFAAKQTNHKGESNMTFGAFISTKRKEAKLNLRDTAKHLGIAYGYLCDIEQGRHPGSRGKICRAHFLFSRIEQRRTWNAFEFSRRFQATVPADLPDYIRKYDIVRATLIVVKEVDATDEE